MKGMCQMHIPFIPSLAERTGFEKSFEYFLEALNPFRGENRIRTCEPVLPVTRFPGVPLQPLEHLSNCKADAKVQ